MSNKYSVILADPPWWYNNRKTGGERKDKTKFGGGAQKHYPLMKAHEIAALPVASIVQEPCILFMWATMPLLYDSKARNFNEKQIQKAIMSNSIAPLMKRKQPHDVLTVLQGWGFNFATNGFTWVKMTKDNSRPKYGPGFYTASNVEICLIAIRGKRSLRPAKKMLESIIMTPRGLHSEKPIEIHQGIDLLYPEQRKVELFARRPYQGWDVWGNQIESTITLENTEERKLLLPGEAGGHGWTERSPAGCAVKAAGIRS